MDGKAVHTTCAYCGVGCGVLATPDANGAVTIAGDENHPANLGRLCSKGSALGETLGLDGRLLHPEVAGFQTSWDEALDLVADRFRNIIEEHGPESVAIYGSGQLLTEDYYVANKLMKGFIGSPNIDTNSRLCMSSTVSGHKRAFGEDVVPGAYEDLELADLTVWVGSNSAWCHPVLFQRAIAARENNPDRRMVVIDPRRTATAEAADLHLQIKPGTDGFLFAGLLSFLARHGALDQDWMRQHTDGGEDTITAAIKYAGDAGLVARKCGISISDLLEFYSWFAETSHVVSLFSQGVNQSATGTDKVNAIINAHLATGRIGKPGMGPFSLTGQPNAMGGREVGGLATMLAAHMELGNQDHRQTVRDFWQAPALVDRPGLPATRMFDAVADGRIKAIWIMATNPAVSLPEAEKVRKALQDCEFVVVSDCVADTETTRCADVLLPALTWGEKDGTVTNSERRISRQRAVLAAPGDARPDWKIICDVARRLGFRDAFDFDSPAAIFREHAGLSSFRNDGERLFDLSALKDISDAGYDAMEPLQWPATTAPASPRLFAAGHPARKLQLVPISPETPPVCESEEWPLVLNSGRVRDQWHTMTRTGRAPRLSQHLVEPYVEIHQADAEKFELQEGGLASVSSMHGSIVARVYISSAQQRGSIFVPIHWSSPNASDARVGKLFEARLDPTSSQPELKQVAASVSPWIAGWNAFALTMRTDTRIPGDYFVRSQGDGFQLLELAGKGDLPMVEGVARNLLGYERGDEWLAYRDENKGAYRFALLRGGCLIGCFVVGPTHELLPRHWLAGLMTRPVSREDRLGLLAGKPLKPGQDTGPIICACFGVGQKTILEAIRSGKASDVAGIGKCLKAGTNCGSCKPELNQLLVSAANREVA